MDAIPQNDLITFNDNFEKSLHQVEPCFYLDQAWLMLQPVLNDKDGKSYREKKLEFVKLLDIYEIPSSPLIMGVHFLRLSSFERLATVIEAGRNSENYFEYSASVNPRSLAQSLNDKGWQSEAIAWLKCNVAQGFITSKFEDFFLNEAEVFRGGRHFRNAYKHGRMIQEANSIRGTPHGLKLCKEPNRRPFWFSFFAKFEGRSWYTLYRPDPMSDAHALNLHAKTIDQIRLHSGHEITSRIENSPSEFRRLFGAEFLSMSNWLNHETWLQSKFVHGTTHIETPQC